MTRTKTQKLASSKDIKDEPLPSKVKIEDIEIKTENFETPAAPRKSILKSSKRSAEVSTKPEESKFAIYSTELRGKQEISSRKKIKKDEVEKVY